MEKYVLERIINGSYFRKYDTKKNDMITKKSNNLINKSLEYIVA